MLLDYLDEREKYRVHDLHLTEVRIALLKLVADVVNEIIGVINSKIFDHRLDKMARQGSTRSRLVYLKFGT